MNRDVVQGAVGSAYVVTDAWEDGPVWRAFPATESTTGRAVIINVLLPEFAAGVVAERFAREVRLLSRLVQSHIVPILAGGDVDGLPFYVMPRIDAPSLRDRLDSGARMSLPQAMHVLRDVAKAMTFAHAHGVVHHGLTPERILLSGDHVMVTDFGIATALSLASAHGGSGSERRRATERRASVTPTSGNPAYRAPEQAVDGMSDLRADLYAWGVLAYELITGTHPFAGSARSGGESPREHPEVPAPIGRENPALPAALASVVMRCLETEPDKRPVSAAGLIVALDSASRPNATPVGPVAVRETVDHSRSHGTTRWFVVLSALVMLAVVAWLRARR